MICRNVQSKATIDVPLPIAVPRCTSEISLVVAQQLRLIFRDGS